MKKQPLPTPEECVLAYRKTRMKPGIATFYSPPFCCAITAVALYRKLVTRKQLREEYTCGAECFKGAWKFIHGFDSPEGKKSLGAKCHRAVFSS